MFADFLTIDYDDYRDVLAGGAAGEEPLYTLDSTILRAYLSVWY